ncbi:MAG: UDP-3-O-(3-hydroxymyristoyl)glucosamine N-acyltransferase [Gammaproteobacteria bacterium]|nr:MAG: UDP-3-O-(3-hydroxymyristoyl)glucosamine N-acyltransferase [Gammaproteobacteria bacterium]
MAISLGELTNRIGGTLNGDADILITGIASLKNARAGDLSFISNKRYRPELLKTAASAVIVLPELLDDCPSNSIVMDDPYAGYALASGLFYKRHVDSLGVHPSSVIADDCVLGENITIGANCVIESGVHLGSNTVIGPGCYIGNGVSIGNNGYLAANISICSSTKIGDNVILHPGVVIGADGFGFARHQGKWLKIQQLGTVLIGKDVEIGANSTIDRASIDHTFIGDGVKIDNQVQVAHNVHIGDDTVIAGCVGIGGSTKIGKRCAIAGKASIVDHVEIHDDVTLTAATFVTESILEPGVYSSGTTAQPNARWRRNAIRFKQLDELLKTITRTEKPE